MDLKGCGVPLMASSKASFSDIGGKEMLRKTVGIYDKAHRDRKKKSKKRDVTGWGMAVQNAKYYLMAQQVHIQVRLKRTKNRYSN